MAKEPSSPLVLSASAGLPLCRAEAREKGSASREVAAWSRSSIPAAGAVVVQGPAAAFKVRVSRVLLSWIKVARSNSTSAAPAIRNALTEGPATSFALCWGGQKTTN